MGNTQSIKSDNIEKSPREELLQNITYGGDSPYMSEINVELVNMQGGYEDEGDEDEINVHIVNIAGGGYTEDYSSFIGGGGCGSGRDDDIHVDVISMAGGAADLHEDEHIAIYKEIKDRISSYGQEGGSSNNEFFKMLEEKLNGVQSESPFISNNVNKFAETLQKGGYMEETETATITANKLMQKIVQMGGDSSSSSSEDSDFTSTDDESLSESSDSDSVSIKEKKSFPLYAVGRQTKKSELEED